MTTDHKGKRHGRNWLRWIAGFAGALVLAALISVPFVAPAVAAYTCPSCYGFEKLADQLYAERGMSERDRAALQGLVRRAKEQVTGFYGPLQSGPAILVCRTDACDHRTGGRGALGETYLGAFIRMSPRGFNQTFLAHELSHAELHARFGAVTFLLGRLPAWVDEGIAVIVSDDDRYLKPDGSGTAKCRAEPVDDMRPGPFEWGRSAGKTPGLYAQAACRVLRWMDANGGKTALLAAIAEVAAERRSLP